MPRPETPAYVAKNGADWVKLPKDKYGNPIGMTDLQKSHYEPHKQLSDKRRRETGAAEMETRRTMAMGGAFGDMRSKKTLQAIDVETMRKHADDYKKESDRRMEADRQRAEMDAAGRAAADALRGGGPSSPTTPRPGSGGPTLGSLLGRR
jgi:hypothetical protein